VAAYKPQIYRKPAVGVSLLAKAECQSTTSDQKIAAFGSSYMECKTCRSCRRLRSFDLCASTGFQAGWLRDSVLVRSDRESCAISCRREPARDGGVSACKSVTDTPPSRAGSLLQGNGGLLWNVKSLRHREMAGAFLWLRINLKSTENQLWDWACSRRRSVSRPLQIKRSQPSAAPAWNAKPVGAAEGCDLLISVPLQAFRQVGFGIRSWFVQIVNPAQFPVGVSLLAMAEYQLANQ